MSKHTPGPWKQGTRGPNGCPIIGTEKGLMVCMLAHSANESGQKEQAEANAHLIAAAPELLEALEELSGIVQGILDDTDVAYVSSHIDSFTLQIAKAAILKAEGDLP